jgi:hypothetical protein
MIYIYVHYVWFPKLKFKKIFFGPCYTVMFKIVIFHGLLRILQQRKASKHQHPPPQDKVVRTGPNHLHNLTRGFHL